MGVDLFGRPPLRIEGGIPVFSRESAYTRNYESIAADHLKWFEEHGTNPWIPEDIWVDLERSTADLIGKYAQDGARILDAGVGLGRLLERFPQLERYGIDISLKYLGIAESKGIQGSYATLEDMPYQDGVFDIVVCTDVLEHVTDLNKCCAQLLRVVKSAGILIVRVPYRERLEPYVADSYPYQFAHLRGFDEYSLRLLFEKILGCRCLEFAMAGYSPSPLRLKCQLDLPLRDRALDWLLKAVRRGVASKYDALLRWLYYAIDVNVVVRKP